MSANTAGTLSEAGIASMAAGLLDDYHITSLDDPTPLGRYFAREFGTVRNEFLESYPWAFAKSRVLLTKLSDDPAFEWSYQYQLPQDCLRPLPPKVDEALHNDLPLLFEVESGKLLCNVGPTLKLKYIRRETNVAKWTALAGRAFAAKMAMYASQRITGKAQYFDKCRVAYMDALFEAQRHDALMRGMPETVYASGEDGYDSLNVREGGYGI